MGQARWQEWLGWLWLGWHNTRPLWSNSSVHLDFDLGDLYLEALNLATNIQFLTMTEMIAPVFTVKIKAVPHDSHDAAKRKQQRNSNRHR